MHASTARRLFAALRRRLASGIAACTVATFAAVAGPARADTASFATVSEATLIDSGSNGSFDTLQGGGGGSLSIRQFAGMVTERVGLEFDVTSLPDAAIVTGARFTFDTVGFTSNTGRVVDIMGYAGNGTITTADGNALATPLGSYNSFTGGLGPQTVSLNTAGVQTLISGDFAGIRFQAGAETVNTQIGSSAFPDSFQPPRLVIDYIVPEPTGAGLLLGGAGLLLAGRGRRGVRP